MRYFSEFNLEDVYISSVLVVEGRSDRYLQMFPNIMRIPSIPGSTNEGYIKDQVDWAIRTLKKDDKIVHYLTWLRLLILYKRITFQSKFIEEPDNPEVLKVKKYYDKLKNKNGVDDVKLAEIYNSDFNPLLNRYQDGITHFMTQGLDVFDDHVWDKMKPPREIYQELEEIEKNYFKGTENQIPLAPNDEIIIKFNDGYAWINTHKPVCSTQESKIMQHCGNQYQHGEEEDEIFALRVQSKEKPQLWEPKLTFVVQGGIIRESKGKQNNKPDAEKYGKYIFELLKSDYIEGFDQYDSHDAQKNFYLTDLDEEYIEQLRELDKDEEHFWDNGGKPDLQKKVDIITKEYGDFNNIDIQAEVAVYDEDSQFINAYAWFGFKLKLPDKLSEDEVEVQRKIIDFIFNEFDIDSDVVDGLDESEWIEFENNEVTVSLSLDFSSYENERHIADVSEAYRDWLRYSLKSLDEQVEDITSVEDKLREYLLLHGLIDLNFHKFTDYGERIFPYDFKNTTVTMNDPGSYDTHDLTKCWNVVTFESKIHFNSLDFNKFYQDSYVNQLLGDGLDMSRSFRHLPESLKNKIHIYYVMNELVDNFFNILKDNGEYLMKMVITLDNYNDLEILKKAMSVDNTGSPTFHMYAIIKYDEKDDTLENYNMRLDHIKEIDEEVSKFEKILNDNKDVFNSDLIEYDKDSGTYSYAPKVVNFLNSMGVDISYSNDLKPSILSPKEESKKTKFSALFKD